MARPREVRSRLPADVSSFVGRSRESAEVRRLLEHRRLVTLTGPGGVGKSRLGLRVAARMAAGEPDGVHFVDLGALGDDRLLGDSVVQALGLVDRSARPPVEVLSEYLAGRRLLLVLDGCEHVSDACATLVGRLLPAAPGLRVLATSREPLQVPGEAVLAVPTAAPRDALELFEQRARAVLPDFSVTAENRDAVERLCERLDRIPLAIELAAVRLRVLSVTQILDRLGDRFRLLARPTRTDGRHATLLATVEWSAQGCSAAERAVWARASVFVGSFDLEAARYVCAGDDVPAEDVAGTLAGLVDKSVIAVRGEGPEARYVWLDTLRDYGALLLAGRGDEQALLRRRHRDWVLSRVRSLSSGSGKAWSPALAAVLQQLGLEPANVRAALDFCFTEPGEERTGLELSTSLVLMWLTGGLVRESRYWLELALAAGDEPSRERVRALWACGWVAIEQGDLPAAEDLLARSRALAGRLRDESGLAWAVALTGYAALFAGDLPRARALLEDGMARHRALGDGLAVRVTLSGLAQTSSYLGDPVAEAISAEAIALADRPELDVLRSTGLRNRGLELVRQGRLDEASESLCEALRLSRTGWLGVATSLDLLAWAASAGGRHQRAARLFGAAHASFRRAGTVVSLPQRERSRHYRALAREALGEPVFDGAFRRGEQLTQEEAIDYALAGARESPESPKARAGASPLSAREEQVVALVTRGLTDRQIAAELVISPRTAQAHVARILAKLELANRAQIAAWRIHRTVGQNTG
jgi:predicted ATPase/DNA-binding CsgD family transcriptional regulator